jgi:hypothetical protein
MTDPTAPVTPRTAAGRQMREFIAALLMRPVEKVDPRHILAIEREAGSTDALRAALERLVAEYDDDPIRPASWISMKQARAALVASDAGPDESMPVTLVGMALHAIKQRDRLHETPCRCEADAFDLRQWHESEALPDDRHSVMGLSRESDR